MGILRDDIQPKTIGLRTRSKYPYLSIRSVVKTTISFASNEQRISVRIFLLRPLNNVAKIVEVDVDFVNSASRFMGGFFFSTAVAAVIMVLLCNAGDFSPFVAKLNAWQQVIVTALVALVIVDIKPLAYKTFWRERRSSFVLDEDLGATLRGRTSGIPAGVIIGILIQNYMVN